MSITLDGSNLTTTGVINSGTAQNSTSGTSIDFTGIPSGVKRITVIFNGVSTNGTSVVQIQVGSGSVDTTGYVSAVAQVNTGGNGAASSTSGFCVDIATGNASRLRSGAVTVPLVGSNIWVQSGAVLFDPSISGVGMVAGNKTLSGSLDRVRITTVNGTDTFDAGSINILYE